MRKAKIVIPKDFCWKTYLKLNSDILCDDETSAVKHYLEYGCNENRKYTMNDGVIRAELGLDVRNVRGNMASTISNRSPSKHTHFVVNKHSKELLRL